MYIHPFPPFFRINKLESPEQRERQYNHYIYKFAKKWVGCLASKSMSWKKRKWMKQLKISDSGRQLFFRSALFSKQSTLLNDISQSKFSTSPTYFLANFSVLWYFSYPSLQWCFCQPCFQLIDLLLSITPNRSPLQTLCQFCICSFCIGYGQIDKLENTKHFQQNFWTFPSYHTTQNIKLPLVWYDT